MRTRALWVAVSMLAAGHAAAAENYQATPLASPSDIVSTMNGRALADLVDQLASPASKPRLQVTRVIGGTTDDQRAEHMLMDAFSKTDAIGVRCKILESLGHLNDPSLIPWFQARLNSPSIAVRCYALWCIGNLRLRTSLPIIRPFLLSREKPMRLTAMDAAGKCGRDSGVASDILPALDDADVQTRFVAAQALQSAGTQDNAPTLFTHLVSEPSVDVQEALAIALGRSAGHLTVERWTTLLRNSPTPDTEHWAVMSLQASDSGEILPAVAPWLTSDHLRLKIVGAHVIAKMTTPAAAAVIRKSLAGDDTLVRLTLLNELTPESGRAVTESIIPLATDKDALLRQAAIDAISRIGATPHDDLSSEAGS